MTRRQLPTEAETELMDQIVAWETGVGNTPKPPNNPKLALSIIDKFLGIAIMPRQHTLKIMNHLIIHMPEVLQLMTTPSQILAFMRHTNNLQLHEKAQIKLFIAR